MTGERKHNHYFKDVQHLQHIDVYRVLSLFNVTDPCIQHAVKKLLVAGGRGAGKDITRDIKEAVDSLVRWSEMREEDASTGALEQAQNRVYDLLLKDDGFAHKEARRYLQAHNPELYAELEKREQANTPYAGPAAVTDRELNVTYYNTGTVAKRMSVAVKDGMFIPVVNGIAVTQVPCSGFTFDVPPGGSYSACALHAGASVFGWHEQELPAEPIADESMPEAFSTDFKVEFFPVKGEGGFAPWTNNGVTITHVPTGRTYSSGDPELSTHKNRDAAWKMACEDLGIGRDSLQP